MPPSLLCMFTVARRRLVDAFAVRAANGASRPRRADELGSFREPPRRPRRSLRRADGRAPSRALARLRATRDPRPGSRLLSAPSTRVKG
eukprot:6353833-Prymnesium_polylepis.1